MTLKHKVEFGVCWRDGIVDSNWARRFNDSTGLERGAVNVLGSDNSSVLNDLTTSRQQLILVLLADHLDWTAGDWTVVDLDRNFVCIFTVKFNLAW